MRIEQKLMGIKSVTSLRLIRPVDAVSINSGRANVRQITVPNLVGVFRECDALKFTFTSLVEQAQLDFGRVSREEGEVCALAVPCCATRMRQSLLYHAFSSCLHEFSFSLQVLSGFRKFKATARSSQPGDGKDSGLRRIQHKQVITQGDVQRRPPVLAITAYLLISAIFSSTLLRYWP